jgi:hypothetical protein
MKITKLSLATIVALGSFSFANAQALEDAIKNVEVSGSVVYRYNDYAGQNNDSNTSNNYKAAINLGSKINDDVKFNSRFIAGDKLHNSEVSLDTQSQGDSNLDVSLSEANFDYTGVKNSVLTIGKQGITTPFSLSRDSLGNEATGTGLVATTNIGGIASLTGGFFNQTNLNNNDGGLGTVTGSESFAYVTGTLAYAGTTLDGTYGQLDNVFDAYTVGLTGAYTLDQVTLAPFARYSSLNLDASSADNTLVKVGMQANLGIFGAYLSYGKTNSEGGTVGTDGSSDTGLDDHWRVTLSGIKDASALYATVDTQVTPKINVSLNYSGMNVGSNNTSDNDQNEIYAKVAYKMSNNLSTYVQAGQYRVDNFYGQNDDLTSNMGRVHVQYTF